MRHAHIFPSLFLLLAFILPCRGLAQRNEILDDRIASLQVMANDDWQSMPVVGLNNGDVVNISFDDLTHSYERLCYKIEHCEADWTRSEEIFESDYCTGFTSDNVIEDYAQSINTNQLYTHYVLSIPNDRCRLRMSGNYRVTVYVDGQEDEPVLTACFMVVEPLMGVGIEMTTNTDIDYNVSHQQINMSLNYNSVDVVSPQTQIKTVLMQNQRWDNAVVNSKPQYVNTDGLRWSHDRDNIFEAGNEYRKFETLDVTHTTMGLERILWDGQVYHAWVFIDEPRPSYIYDESANGSFLIRNSDNVESDVTCDYLWVHFRLKSPRLPYDIYLNGTWTNDRFLPQYKMEWNGAEQQYECKVWLKQGYYSYQYLMLSPNGTWRPVPSEGNFYQTRNTYQALVYYRGRNDRTDRLVAYQELR